MKLVIVESPYACVGAATLERHVRYARACLRDCLLRGEAPFASHLIYTQEGVLRDEVPGEREHGMRAGFAWRSVADKTVVYTDLGISAGMAAGVKDSEDQNVLVEYRKLEGEWSE